MLCLLQAEHEKQLREVGDILTELQKLSDQISDMQGEIDERASMTNTGAGPVAKARKAVQQIKDEMRTMDVRLGVARQQLLHRNLKAHLQAGG